MSQLSFGQRFFPTLTSVDQVTSRRIQSEQKALLEQELSNQDDHGRKCELPPAHSSSLTPIKPMNLRRRNFKIIVSKVDEVSLKKKTRLESIKRNNSWAKEVISLDVSLKKEMMNLDSSESLVSCVTGNKVQLIFCY